MMVMREVFNKQNASSQEKATASIVHLLKYARKYPKERQASIQKALKLIDKVPMGDSPQDLVRKLKNEASKDINSSDGKKRNMALDAVKACDARIEAGNVEWLTAHAGMGVEGIITTDIIADFKSNKQAPSSKKDPPAQTTTDLMLSYAGS